MNFAERFLIKPEHYPDSAVGTTWGQESVMINMAAERYIVNGLSKLQAEDIHERFGDLCHPGNASANNSRAALTLYRRHPKHFKTVNFHGGEYTFDLSYSANEVRLAGLNFMGCFSLNSQLRAGLWVPDQETLVSHGIFENVFRTLVAYCLLQVGGVLLHSGAVTDTENAYLFFGRSGAGKSTVSRLALEAGLDVLSDDMNALVPFKNGFVVEKLPFAGDLGQTSTPRDAHPVKSMYWLKQSDQNLVHKMKPGNALASLITCSAFVNADPYRLEQLMSNLTDLALKVPISTLQFRRDSDFQSLVSE